MSVCLWCGNEFAQTSEDDLCSESCRSASLFLEQAEMQELENEYQLVLQGYLTNRDLRKKPKENITLD